MNDFKLIPLIKVDLGALFEKISTYLQFVNAIIRQTHRSPLAHAALRAPTQAAAAAKRQGHRRCSWGWA